MSRGLTQLYENLVALGFVEDIEQAKKMAMSMPVGSGGSSSFIKLSDTPESYSGAGGKFVKVKATEDGLEFGLGDGSGDVQSVNGLTGTVVLDTDDIAEGGNNLYFTEARVQDFADTTYLRLDASNGPITGALAIQTTSTQLTLAYNGSNSATLATSSTGALTITPKIGQSLNVSLSGTGDFAVNTNHLYVDTSTARVGIGTASPSNTLHIVGDLATYANGGSTRITHDTINQGKIIVNAGDNVLNAAFLFDITGVSTTQALVRFFRTTSTTGLTAMEVLKGDNTNTINVRLSGNNDSYINGNNGNVGIGATTTPDAKLEVFGDIRARQYVSNTTNIETVSGTYTSTKMVYRFNESRGLGYNSADDAIYFAMHTSVMMVVTPTAVSIGANAVSDSAKLYVNGKISTSDELEVNGAFNHDGTAVGFYGASPTTRQVLATGAGATVDNVISVLQTLGLVSQS